MSEALVRGFTCPAILPASSPSVMSLTIMRFPEVQAPLSMEFSGQNAISFSRGSAQPRDQTQTPVLQADSLLNEPTNHWLLWMSFM